MFILKYTKEAQIAEYLDEGCKSVILALLISLLTSISDCCGSEILIYDQLDWDHCNL